MATAETTIVAVDPQGPDALALLMEASIDARALYPELFAPDSPPARNEALPPRAVYLLAYVDGRALASGAIMPLSAGTAELRRMYVHRAYRRQGLARALLDRLIHEAQALGYQRLVLETGNKQLPAVRLYETQGFAPIPAFGPYIGDPTSLCFGLDLPLEGKTPA